MVTPVAFACGISGAHTAFALFCERKDSQRRFQSFTPLGKIQRFSSAFLLSALFVRVPAHTTSPRDHGIALRVGTSIGAKVERRNLESTITMGQGSSKPEAVPVG